MKLLSLAHTFNIGLPSIVEYYLFFFLKVRFVPRSFWMTILHAFRFFPSFLYDLNIYQ